MGLLPEPVVVALVTLFVVIDPIGQVPLFAALTAHLPSQERRRVALRGVLIAGGVLMVFALGGRALLRLLGIGLPAFRIAGGILLLLLSIDMIMVRPSGLRATTPDEDVESSHRADLSVFPLAIPLIAGPGALTSVVILMDAAHRDLVLQLEILGVLIVVLAATLACLRLTGPLMRLLGVTGAHVATRVFGIVLAALAVQFMIDGVLALWRAPLTSHPSCDAELRET